MKNLFGSVLILTGRFHAMTPPQQYWAIMHGVIDALLWLFLILAVYVGFTSDFATFYFWVPFLAIIVWMRLKQARHRWSP